MPSRNALTVADRTVLKFNSAGGAQLGNPLSRPDYDCIHITQCPAGMSRTAILLALCSAKFMLALYREENRGKFVFTYAHARAMAGLEVAR